MNIHAMRAIYKFEMARTRRTLMQSIISPVLSTSLYFVVFGAAIGSRITQVEGISYGAFIVPGLIMLSLLTQSITNAAFGIYSPRFVGTIYEVLSAPVSYLEIVTSYVGAAFPGATANDCPPLDHCWSGASTLASGVLGTTSVFSSGPGSATLAAALFART